MVKQELCSSAVDRRVILLYIRHAIAQSGSCIQIDAGYGPDGPRVVVGYYALRRWNYICEAVANGSDLTEARRSGMKQWPCNERRSMLLLTENCGARPVIHTYDRHGLVSYA